MVRSRGQMARRESFTSSSSQQGRHRSRSARTGTTTTSGKRDHDGDGRGTQTSAETPLLGGLTSLDILFIGVAYAFNLVRTLAVGELFDVAAKAIYYCVLSLPFDFWRRWRLSRPAARQDPSSCRRRSNIGRRRPSNASNDAQTGRRRGYDRRKRHEETPDDADATAPRDPTHQLTPFHHLVILLTRFACSNFPHLLPRVLFAEDTMLPFVGWRTGGASWDLLREIRGPDVAHDAGALRPSFKAMWMGEDAHDERTDPRATTLFYLHGGGFSLGSVSFYAEALLRLLKKVSALEAGSARNARTRCIAVEYDLSPAARFPGPLLQCLRCYAHLVEVEGIDPRSIVVAGDSAGANLAMGLLLAISGQARSSDAKQSTQRSILDERDWSTLPMPGKALLISPWVDLRPSQAHAFASLRRRQAAQARPSEAGQGSRGMRRQSRERPQPSRRNVDANALADSMVKFDWDYVASESLLHFAQVYAGVLPEPRRVLGPTGWLSHLCGVLSQGLEADDDLQDDHHGAASSVMDPARRFARAVRDTLEHPLFAKLSSSDEDETRSSQVVQSAANTAAAPHSFVSGLRPLFNADERRTRGVRSTRELYAPFQSEAGNDPGTSGETNADTAHDARLDAEQALEHDPLLSPILGDWSKVHLEHGIMVTWGERERLAADIQAWVNLVRHGRQQPVQPEATESRKDAPPRQDGEGEPEAQAHTSLEQDSGAYSQVHEVVEQGPGGVHAWPFVSMYLAGSDQERERGLDTLAQWVARSTASGDPIEPTESSRRAGASSQRSSDSPAFPPSSPPQNAPLDDDDGSEGPFSDDDADQRSHGSMPSDLEEGSDAADRTRRGALVGRPFSEDEYREALGLGVHWDSPADVASNEDPEQAKDEAEPPHVTYPPRSPEQVHRGDLRAAPPSQGHGRPHGSSVTSAAGPALPSDLADGSDAAGGHEGSAGVAPGQVVQLPWWSQGVEAGSEAGPRSAVIGRCLHDDSDPSEPSDEEIWENDPTSLNRDDNDPRFYDQGAYEQGPAHPSHFGLSYAFRRDFEGLSDITEEGSVLSSSMLSVTGPGRQGEPHPATRGAGPALARTESTASESPPDDNAVLSPETRRMIRLEAVRQLAAEAGVEDFDLDDDEGSAIFSPVSEDAYSSGLPLGFGSLGTRSSDSTSAQRQPTSVDSQFSGGTMTAHSGGGQGTPAVATSPRSDACQAEQAGASSPLPPRSRSRSGSESGGEAWWAS